ncbi:MAG: lysophospholipid acyltransferase family protein [Mariprofundaceae bacterium]|nr:lysophospholipid acyltransferase family protein [Mariprofundaceae bacterium]
MKKRLLAWLAPRLIILIYYLLRLTIRWKFKGQAYDKTQAPFILCFWHSRILMMPYMMSGWDGPMLISEHQDGKIIADAVSLLGIGSARGSSTRSGVRALLQMVRMARAGHTLGITPDGPKGPREQVSMGTVMLARKTGLPIRPVSYACSAYWRAKSWDRFYIPKPFSKGIFIVGDDLFVSKEMDDEEAMQYIQKAMDENTQQAENYFS